MPLNRIYTLSITGLALTTLLLIGCSKQEEEVATVESETTEVAEVEVTAEATNPFSETWYTPFGAPPFGKIKTEHFFPAFEKAFAEHLAEIDAITNDDVEPTFDNTLAQIELAGGALDRVRRVFINLTYTESNDEMQKLQSEISPRLTLHNNEIGWSPVN